MESLSVFPGATPDHRRPIFSRLVLPLFIVFGFSLGPAGAFARTIHVHPTPYEAETRLPALSGNAVCGSVMSDSTEFQLCLERDVFHFGESVIMEYSVTNRSSSPKTYELPTLCEELFFVTAMDCEPLECPAVWAQPRLCFQLEMSFDLGPGETREYEFDWTQHRTEGERVPPGAYRAWATLYWGGDSALASVPFELVAHGPQPIQEALGLATAGDTVLVAQGIYRENLNLLPEQSGVVLLSESGPQSTILDGDGRGSVLYMRGVNNQTVVEGFTIRGGEGRCGSEGDCEAGVRGGGLSLLAGARARVRGNVIAENHSFVDGGGLAAMSPAGADLRGNLFLRNVSEGVGGGVYCQGGRLEVIGNTFVGNEATEGGGVYDRADTQFARVLQNIFYANVADSYGALRCAAATGEFCNAYWQNVPEDAEVSCGGLNEEVLSDPLFCLPQLDVYRLRPGSPCLAENSPCGELIGADGEVCEPASADPVSGSPQASGLTVLGPNPSRGEVRIGFRLPGTDESAAEIVIYDVRGRLVQEFHPPSGAGVWAWDGTDSQGQGTAAGVYWARLRDRDRILSEVAIVRLR